MPKLVYLFIGGREWDALLGLWTHSFSLVRIVALLMRPWTHWVEFLKKSLHTYAFFQIFIKGIFILINFIL